MWASPAWLAWPRQLSSHRSVPYPNLSEATRWWPSPVILAVVICYNSVIFYNALLETHGREDCRKARTEQDRQKN